MKVRPLISVDDDKDSRNLASDSFLVDDALRQVTEFFSQGMVGPARPLFFCSDLPSFSTVSAMTAGLLFFPISMLVRPTFCCVGMLVGTLDVPHKVVDQIFPKDAPVQPSLIVVYFSGNDSLGAHPSGLGPHVPLPEYIENMRSILNHLKSLSKGTRIIVRTCPPINEEMTRQFQSPLVSKLDRTNVDLQRYAESCIQLCKDMDLKVVDLFNAIQKRENWITVCFTDGIHFSREGSIIVVKEILEVLRKAEWEPSLHWKSLATEFSDGSPYDIVTVDGKSTFNVSELSVNWSMQWN